jgi:hypothetical protein
MLSDFFRINLPYGMRRNDKNEWYCFNREYKPLGFNQANKQYKFVDYPIFTRYKAVTDQKLLEIAGGEDRMTRDEKGMIQAVWFYDDGDNPMNVFHRNKSKCWLLYFKKLKLVSQLRTDIVYMALQNNHT